HAFGQLKFATILLDNVSIGQMHKDSLGPNAEFIKRFIYRNRGPPARGQEYACPRFHTHTKYDLFEALRQCRYLQTLELCAHNQNEEIPADAFDHNYLRTIRFYGNFSKYSIE